MILIEWLARIILIILIGLSVYSVAIILDRRKFFKAIDENIKNKKLENFSENDLFFGGIIKVFQSSKSSTAKDHEFEYYLGSEKLLMDKGLSVLGTLGSTTPFIGLLGTILGIIVSFGKLSAGSVDTFGIMYALAEALILTAVGLFVAIPAVIAFNIFNKKIKYLQTQAQNLRNYLLSKEI